MVLGYAVCLRTLGDLACGAEEVEGAAGVAVLLRCEGGTERDDVVREDVVLEGYLGALFEYVA